MEDDNLRRPPSSVTMYYPGQKNRYSRKIHEVDLDFDHVISCDIELRFDIDATRGYLRVASWRRGVALADRSGCRMISHDRTADQSNQYLGCNDFFGQGSKSRLGQGLRSAEFVTAEQSACCLQSCEDHYDDHRWFRRRFVRRTLVCIS